MINWEIISQLILAAVLGAVVGLERELAKKEAGIKTCSLVSLGAALFTIIPQISQAFAGFSAFDPSRVLSQIIVGVGFIGAGVIMIQKTYVSGVTTAASLWVVAGIGAAIGFKLFDIAIAATIISLIVLIIIGRVERKYISDRNE